MDLERLHRPRQSLEQGGLWTEASASTGVLVNCLKNRTVNMFCNSRNIRRNSAFTRATKLLHTLLQIPHKKPGVSIASRVQIMCYQI